MPYRTNRIWRINARSQPAREHSHHHTTTTTTTALATTTQGLDAEQLSSLLATLPSAEDSELVTGYDGPVESLGKARAKLPKLYLNYLSDLSYF